MASVAKHRIKKHFIQRSFFKKTIYIKCMTCLKPLYFEYANFFNFLVFFCILLLTSCFISEFDMFERYVVDCCVIPYVIQDIYCMMQSSQVDLQAESERPQASTSRRWGGGGQ